MNKKVRKKPISSDKAIEDLKKRREERIQKILYETEKARKKFAKKGKGWNFTGIDEEEIKKKLPKSNSPLIIYQSWTSATSPGSTINYTVGINNPDPEIRFSLFLYVFVGPANTCPDACAALALEDPRFPRLILPKFEGLSLSPGATEELAFSIAVPSNVEPSVYMGNSFLLRVNWHGIGWYNDRSCFVFEVT
jgi:hypothetical protein